MSDRPDHTGQTDLSRRIHRREFDFEPACPGDAAALAELITMARYGLPLVAWGKSGLPGETPLQTGARCAARDRGAFSYRHANVLRDGRAVVGAMLSYPIVDRVGEAELATARRVFQPLLGLENLAVGSYHISVLAVQPAFRGRGLGTRLLAHAQTRMRRAMQSRMSLIAGDIDPARSLYERFGFVERARAMIVKNGWDYAGCEWVLYVKDLAYAAGEAPASSGWPKARSSVGTSAD